MKELNQLEAQHVSGGSLDQVFTGISPNKIFDIDGVPHVDYRVAHGVIGFSPCVMVPLSEVDYSLPATVGRIANNLNAVFAGV